MSSGKIASTDLSPEWKLAQVKMLETSCLQALDGLDGADEDYLDTWASGIPTHIKREFPIVNEDGKRVSFLDEWNGLNATIEPGESEPVRRRRILRKRQLIVDLLHEVKAWMKIYVETEPEIGGALFRPFNKGGKHGSDEEP
jgi:hypothetical protein